MRKSYLLVLIAGWAILGAGCDSVFITQTQRLDKQCRDFGKNVLDEHKDLFTNKNSEINFFYSKRLDTCLKTEVDELGIEYSICDIKRNYIKQEFTDMAICGGIFYCDKDGVDNVVLAKAEAYGGKVFDIPYSEYLDDGDGGKPRTIKTPEKPYTREKCVLLFQKKLKEVK